GFTCHKRRNFGLVIHISFPAIVPATARRVSSPTPPTSAAGTADGWRSATNPQGPQDQNRQFGSTATEGRQSEISARTAAVCVVATSQKSHAALVRTETGRVAGARMRHHPPASRYRLPSEPDSGGDLACQQMAGTRIIPK